MVIFYVGDLEYSDSLFFPYLSSYFFFSYGTEKLLVLLRDGRKLMGTLRSFDQFGIADFFLLIAFSV